MGAEWVHSCGKGSSVRDMTTAKQEKHDAWDSAAGAWNGEGTAYRSRYSPNPLHHILVKAGGGLDLWCSGSRGSSGVVNNFHHRQCPRCMTLALEMLAADRAEDEALR